MVLKALSIGRAPLAAAVGVDKSLISRWCSGQVVPSEHNRARLTQFIAGHQAGFSMLDWELPLDELAAKLGVAAPAPVKLAPGLADWVPPAMLVEAAANVQLHGASYEGFWRSTRPSSEAPGQFIHEHILLRRRDDGMLGMWLGIMDITYVGWSIPIGTKLFSIATDTTTGTFAFSIFNGVTRQRAEVVDGLILTCMRDAGVTPIASKCLLERIGDVSGDATADEARLAELAQTYPLSPAADIAEHVRNHLWSDTGPAAFAAGGDTILMMALARSMSRGASYEDQRKPAV
jgi:transcriptional regulator with XRE-family HTH domain